MRRLFKAAILLGLLGGLAALGLILTDKKEDVTLAAAAGAEAVSAEHGALLLGLAGCVNCHTDKKEGAAPLAGGRALETPVGAEPVSATRDVGRSVFPGSAASPISGERNRV